MKYESLEELLKHELAERIPSKYYLPESHEECLRDIQMGKVLSTECLKAIRERSIYNQLSMTLLWQEVCIKCFYNDEVMLINSVSVWLIH